jgi:hypothetical protein
MIGTRILVDANDPADIAAVNALQEGLQLQAGSNIPFAPPAYDPDSYTVTRRDLLELARGYTSFKHAFGRTEEVDPIRHLFASAAAWGGLPDAEAQYLNVDPGLPMGEYKIEVGEVPVDAFWSISLYNKMGYFERNQRELYNINNLTADKNTDGTITINFGVSDDDKPNYFPIIEGWNYMARLYQPRETILDGSWTFPALEPA